MVSELVINFMFRILTGIILCLLLNIAVCAQQSTGYFYITGKVKVEQGLVDDTRIQVSRDGALLNNVLINRTGTFRIRLDLNHVYRFEFSKDGFYPKTIELDAHIPPEVCNTDCAFPPYQLALMLYKKVPGVEETSSEVGRISYNPKVDNFDAEMLRQKEVDSAELIQIIIEVKAESKAYDLQIQKNKNEKYKQAVAEADQFYRAKDYDKAMHRYRDAVLLFPEIVYPRNQVNVCYSLLVANELQQSLGDVVEGNFMRYLNYGDLQFKNREYTVAKVCYEKALQIKPDNASIKGKLFDTNTELKSMQDIALKEVEHRKEVYQSRTVKYNELILKGDEQFKTGQYAEAKDFYAQAAMQIEENSYSVLMIKKIDELTSDDAAALELAKQREAAEKEKLQKARNLAYNDAIAEADRLFDQRLYRDAIENYELALTIKSYEIYPNTQIKISKDILASLQLKGEEYNSLLRNADALFYNKDYANARPVYEQAHQIIPDEKYALQKMGEIDRLLVLLKKNEAIDENYATLIQNADQLFQQQKYTEAISAYQQASAVKPDEDYPKQQINKIRGILSRETDAKKRLAQQQSDYKQVIALADNAFIQQSYSRARSLYQEALQIIPGQDYPSSQISKIDGILREKAKQKATDSKLDQIDFSNLQNISQDDRKAAYDEAMARGAEFMKSKEWGIARFYFRRALALFPDDPPATQKLSEVERQISGSNGNEVKYAEMISKADEAYKTGDFGVAKFYYTKAREANPTDEYVNERLNVVAKLAENTASRTANKEFDLSLKKADEAMAVQNYSVARFFYRKALSLKQNDPVIKKKLDEVEALINQH